MCPQSLFRVVVLPLLRKGVVIALSFQRSKTYLPLPKNTLLSLRKTQRSPLEYIWNLTAESWILEAWAWTLAVVSRAVTPVLLKVFNHEPLSKFQPNLTLNTLVSAGGQISQTALIVPFASSISQLKWTWYQKHTAAAEEVELFDQASRGIVGLIMLLFRKPKM